MKIEQGRDSLLKSLESLVGQGGATRTSTLKLARASGELDPVLHEKFLQLVACFDHTLRETGDQLAALRQMLSGFPHPAQ